MSRMSENVNEPLEDDDDLGEGPFSLPFDPSEYLESPEACALYLDEALKYGDAKFFAKCMGHVAKAVGMTELARRSGISRQTLYDALSGETTPRMDTILGVLDALGVRLAAVAPEPEAAEEEEREAAEAV